MRPQNLEAVLGQDDAIQLLKGFVAKNFLPNLVFFGPPGCGKTTLCLILAETFKARFEAMNATSCSVKDIRAFGDLARQSMVPHILFMDEIHRLNKSQQDVLLPYTEKGTFVLIGSTTENPFFALNKALRSRVQLVKLDACNPQQIESALLAACETEPYSVEPEALAWIAQRVNGDLRLAYSVLEASAAMAGSLAVTLDQVSFCLRSVRMDHDRAGDAHYDVASAFQKSLRGSDEVAAMYYLKRFLEGGEDPRFIARRLLVTASEDVGNADPMAFVIAGHAFRAVEVLGLPECQIPLAQATLYVARAPKSNESVTALGFMGELLQSRPLDPVPSHLRDAHYQGAEQLGHGKGYIYSHNQPDVKQRFLPEGIAHQHWQKNQSPALNRKRLHELLDQVFANQEWAELDIQDLAQKMGLEVAHLRKELNEMVQQGELEFKRVFKKKF